MQQARRRGSGWILQISKIRKGGGRKEQLISSHLTSLHLENFARDDWDFHFKPPKKSKFKT